MGISNGQLLSRAAAEFDVFVTVDRNLPFQQHLAKFDIAVILLRAKTNRITGLVALVSRIAFHFSEREIRRGHFDRPLTIGSSDRGAGVFGEWRRESMLGIKRVR